MAAEVGGRHFDHNLDTDSDADIYDDHADNLDLLQFDSRSSSALGGLPLGNIQNISHRPSLDTITVALSNFHIHTISKENVPDPETGKPRGHKGRPQLDKNTFEAPLATRSEDHAHCVVQTAKVPTGASTEAPTAEDFEAYNPVAFESRRLPSNQEQLSKHQAGQFEWVLSIPAASNLAKGSRSLFSSHEDPDHPDETKKLYFGCNLVHRRTQSGGAASKHSNSANIYTLLATQLEGDEVPSVTQSVAVEEPEVMSTTQVVDSDTTILRMSEQEDDEKSVPRMSETTTSVKNDDIVDEIVSLSPAHPTSRIEDSVEALDKLEEELEAVSEVAWLHRGMSPKDTKPPARSLGRTVTKPSSLPRSNSTTKREAVSSTASRTRLTDRTSSFRKSTSLVFSMEEEKPAASSTSLRKLGISRPTSLLPPKAPVKSTKPPTVPTFELPGEAVARRLKQQRAARLSQSIDADQAAAAMAMYSPAKPHVKSTKPPTRPSFELPGDAISRRKQEAREAKLRAQEEEERRRREFKARPIRASAVPTWSYPRETIASKARRSKAGFSQAGAEDAEPTVVVAAATTTKKRQSMTLTGSSISRPSINYLSASSTLPTRGRTSAAGSSAGGGRATSTASTASISVSVGKRSSVSAEDVQQQKVRGREIMDRDNRLVAERERERREREAGTLAARKEAAERSRQLSREWAEKQRARVAA